ncbi:protein SPIRAL1-like 1 [Argentina anserina]|uniref:protein SPIRAL1-like 1 n=1 Tax=Argentina anserina TaxID=57926 RepID=UPI0021763F81|nr:protein SPIRAL1-like 1 [Potentilla anserina]
MGRGVSCGGGQSSLGYLFGGGAEVVPNNTRSPGKNASANSLPIEMQPPAGVPTKRDGVDKQVPAASNPTKTQSSPIKTTSPPATKPIDKNIAAGIHSSPTNNYLRLDGQNCGNFITDRPSTKVHSAPGGGSSLGYLFGGGGGK